MLSQDQYTKLKSMGLSQGQINQVTQAAGGVKEAKTLGGFVGNIAESGANLVGDTAKAIFNPIQTVKSIISLVKDPQVLVDYYKNRYGKDLGETLYNDPVGVLADLSAVIGGGAGVAKGVSALTKSAKAGNVASSLAKVSNLTDPLQATGRLLKRGVGTVTSKLDDANVS